MIRWRFRSPIYQTQPQAITVNVSGVVGDPADVARQIRRSLIDIGKRNGVIEFDRPLSADQADRLRRKWKRLNSRPLYAKGREPRTA